MNKRPFILFGILALICAIAIPLLAFGKHGHEGSDGIEVASRDKDGMELFADNCGTCHTLEAAGTDGVVGPNLDDLIGLQSAAGGEEAWAGGYSRVLSAVDCGVSGRMPQGILEADNAETVASFVAAYAGRLSPDQGPGVNTDEVERPETQPCASSADRPSEDDSSSN